MVLLTLQLKETPNTTGPSIIKGFELVFAVDGAGNLIHHQMYND